MMRWRPVDCEAELDSLSLAWLAKFDMYSPPNEERNDAW